MIKKKSLIVLSISLTAAAALSSPPVFAKKIWPAELLARDLNIPGLGWLGHVAIATAFMTNPSGMNQNATQVIEVLDEPVVGQINTISNFKARSPYWGSKYGVADRGVLGYNVLVEANHQRWWCPVYTKNTDYQIGEGIPTTGQILKCGRWRCDTFVWWAYFSQGYDTMPGRVWLPRNLFNYFPFFNDERVKANNSTLSNEIGNRTLEAVSAQELNTMSYEEFQMIMDAPPTNYVTSPSTVQLQLAANPELNDVKRGIMIDKLVSRSAEPDLVKKLLAIYYDTERVKVKSKIIENLMLYNQQHHNDKSYIHNEQPMLKDFFSKILEDNKSQTQHIIDTGLRGYIDTHTADEIMNNLEKINEKLSGVNHYSSVMLKYTLTFKSKELQKIYMKSLVDELKSADDSDLDSYLFGPLSIAFQGADKDFLEPESKQEIIEYLKEVRHKYTPQGIKANPKDFHRSTTAPYYFELSKSLGL